MSQDALSPRQFYHGTTAELQPGDVIKPAKEVGKKNYPGLQSWRHERVWMTDSEKGSWNWGQEGAHHDEKDFVKSYEVEPAEEPRKQRPLDRPDPDMGHEYTASSAVVKRRIDIRHPDVYGPPDVINGRGHPGNPVQGRLPGLNWGKTQLPDDERIERFRDSEQQKSPEPRGKPRSRQGKLF